MKIKKCLDIRRTFEVIAKKLLGAKYERLFRSVVIMIFLYFLWSNLGIDIQVSYRIFLFTIFTFTFGIVAQILLSYDNSKYLKGLFMLPFDSKIICFSYFISIVVYTFFTKTSLILVLYISFTSFKFWDIIIFILVFINACLVGMVAVALFKSNKRLISIFLLLVEVLFCFVGSSKEFYFMLYFVSMLILGFILSKINAYSYLCSNEGKLFNNRKNFNGKGIFLLYIFRYMRFHKSYIVNTVAFLVFACFFAKMIGQFGFTEFLPLGFAVLSFNTPLGILLSCDKSLYKRVISLPKQVKSFLIPYQIFIFISNIVTYAVYLFSWKLLNGMFPPKIYLIGIFFAIQNALLTVLLEWKYPILHWNVESDLWHHPRKYIIPSIAVIQVIFISAFFYNKYIIVIILCVLIVEIYYIHFQFIDIK